MRLISGWIADVLSLCNNRTFWTGIMVKCICGTGWNVQSTEHGFSGWELNLGLSLVARCTLWSSSCKTISSVCHHLQKNLVRKRSTMKNLINVNMWKNMISKLLFFFGNIWYILIGGEHRLNSDITLLLYSLTGSETTNTNKEAGS